MNLGFGSGSTKNKGIEFELCWRDNTDGLAAVILQDYGLPTVGSFIQYNGALHKVIAVVHHPAERGEGLIPDIPRVLTIKAAENPYDQM